MSTEREAFEKWACKWASHLDLARCEDDAEYYRDRRTETAWRAVQAALARARAEPVAWLVADAGGGGEHRFRTIKQGIPEWTLDQNDAIQFARRADAERFAAEDEDAWCILPVPRPTAPAEADERLRAFAKDIMRAWPEGGVDGGELQEAALRHGLLEPATPTQEERDEWGLDEGDAWYRKTALLTPNTRI